MRKPNVAKKRKPKILPVRLYNKYYPTDMFDPKKAYDQALMLIYNSVANEREDELLYDYLINEAPSEDQRLIITSIRDDERKHNKMLRELYYQLTGMDVPPNQGNEPVAAPESFLAGIKQALFGELGAVERYRQILYGMPNQTYRNMITEIYTDELKHASKYNYLFTTNYAQPMI
ncbi:MAG: ferritin-like domain-containing protein [Methylocystaceae bacterium]